MDDAKRRAEETYDAAAGFFDDSALGFWDRFGRATVDRLELRPGPIVRATCDALSVDERHAVRAKFLAAIADRHVTTIETNVIYAQANKPIVGRT